MISTIYAVALAIVLHCQCVDMDEQVRYEQLAMLQAERAAAAVGVVDDGYYDEPAYYYDSYYDPAWTAPSDGLNAWSGVNYHDGRTETYYSSNVLYHYRTNEWWLDDEGFYRTEDGFYVVAASDMEQGTTFEGSKGTCIVLDSGCDYGVTDYYVRW